MRHYTKRYVAAVLRGIIAEKPDVANPGCHYTRTDGSGVAHCIAGEFLAVEGLTLPDEASNQNDHGFRDLAETGFWADEATWDPEAIGLLADTQFAADDDFKLWGWLPKHVSALR